MADIRVQAGPFDAGAEMAALTAGHDDIGGVGCFVGLVRATDGVAALTLEALPGHDRARDGGHRG